MFEIIELVEVIEQAALAELSAFGCIEFEEEVPVPEWANDEVEAVWDIAYETRPLIELW